MADYKAPKPADVGGAYIAKYWLTFAIDGQRVLVRPGAPLPAGLPEHEIRTLAEGGAISKVDKVDKAAKPKPTPVSGDK